MKFVKQNAIIIDDIDYRQILKKTETIGRVCYKSEDRMTPDSAESFIRNIIKMGHESVLEHVSITVRFITDRGVANELVRHRMASYSQESTRYVNYEKGDMEFIETEFTEGGLSEDYYRFIESTYGAIIRSGNTPQQARDVLPLCLKTDIVCTANIREWRHILKLRTDRRAHPKIAALMTILLRQFKEQLPVFFEDIQLP